MPQNKSQTWEERFNERFTYGGITGTVALNPEKFGEDPRPFKDFISQELDRQKQDFIKEVEKMKKEVSPEDEYASDYGTGKLFGWNDALDDVINLLTKE